MNLSDERNYQKMVELLDSLDLTEKNRQLAEKYLDMDQPEDRMLLSQVEKQNLAKLAKDNCRKSVNYLDHCQKRSRLEEKERYVRFMAAVGGATSYYVFRTYGYNTSTLQPYLTKAQEAAIRAEGIAWNAYLLKSAVENLGEKDPEVLYQATQLCYNESDNARVMLTGIYLSLTKPAKAQGGLKSLFSKSNPETEKRIQEAVKFLTDNLTGSMPNMFGTGAVTEEDMKTLQRFVLESRPEDPIPAEIYAILRGRMCSDYLITLLSGASFLAVEHSDRFVAFIKLTTAIDLERKKTTTLDVCLEINKKQWFYDHMEALESKLPISKEDYIAWCIKSKAGEPVKRIAANDPDSIRHAMEKVSVDGMQYLMNWVKESNKKLYQELSSSYVDDFRIKMSEELTCRYKSGKNEARQYLLGDAELDIVLPFVKDMRDSYGYADRSLFQKIVALRDNGNEPMYRRALVLIGLSQKPWFFHQNWVNQSHELKGADLRYFTMNKQQLLDMIDLFTKEQMPVSYQLEALTGIYDNFYNEKDKAAFMNVCADVVAGKKQEWSDMLVSQAKDGIAIVRYLCVRVLDMYWQEYKDTLLACAQDSSKQVRELLAAVYESHKEWEPEILSMLGSKKSQEREMAVLVLKKWGAGAYQAELAKALEAEKSKKIKELIQSCLGIEAGAEPDGAKEKTSEELAAELLKGGKKRKVAWVCESPLPQVHKLDGSAASDDYMQALLVAYADMGIPGISADAAKLAKELDAKELSAYVSMVFSKWMETGAEAKKKWVLYAASIHGGEAIVPVLHAQIQEWPNVSRGAMAAEAVKALALNGSSTALLMVDQISRKFKFRQVKVAAADALNFAAEQLGITKAELEDRIVPSLGFDERMEQIFDYGTRKFTVILTPALELQIMDESGKRIKNLPAPGKKDDEEKAKAASDAFKLLKKQLKTVVTNQKLRLEQALSSERLWPAAQWTELFVKNPVMHQFAIGLIWGLYDNGELKDTFRYMEDGSFNTADEDEYDFPENGMIGLVHPIELEKETLDAWKEQLSDYEITQPIEQLERTVYHVADEEKESTELARFGGKLLNGLSLSGKLQGMGWYRGSVQDAGCYYTFYREDGEIGVELEFSGAYVGDENEEVTVYGAQFYKAGTVKRGSYVYDTVKKENQYALGQVSPRYFSEIIIQLTKATASSQEQLAYPDCKNQ